MFRFRTRYHHLPRHRYQSMGRFVCQPADRHAFAVAWCNRCAARAPRRLRAKHVQSVPTSRHICVTELCAYVWLRPPNSYLHTCVRFARANMPVCLLTRSCPTCLCTLCGARSACVDARARAHTAIRIPLCAKRQCTHPFSTYRAIPVKERASRATSGVAPFFPSLQKFLHGKEDGGLESGLADLAASLF